MLEFLWYGERECLPDREGLGGPGKYDRIGDYQQASIEMNGYEFK